MPVFDYKAVQQDGGIAEGQLQADGRQEAFRQIDAMGLRPIRLLERGGTAIATTSTSASYILAWLAAALFALSLFLPAVNMTPWLRGWNLFALSFYGTVVLGFVSVVEGVKTGNSLMVANFVLCLVGASANVLMLSTFYRINRGRRPPGDDVAVPGVDDHLTSSAKFSTLVTDALARADSVIYSFFMCPRRPPDCSWALRTVSLTALAFSASRTTIRTMAATSRSV